MNKTCFLIGHQEIKRRSNGLFFVDTVWCGRCGNESTDGRRWKYGILREPFYDLLHWTEHKAHIIKASIHLWWTRNDPPPF